MKTAGDRVYILVTPRLISKKKKKKKVTAAVLHKSQQGRKQEVNRKFMNFHVSPAAIISVL